MNLYFYHTFYVDENSNSEGETLQSTDEKSKEEIENSVKEEKDSVKEEKMETDEIDDKKDEEKPDVKIEEVVDNIAIETEEVVVETVSDETDVKQEPNSETEVKKEVKDEPMDVDDNTEVVKVEDDSVKTEETDSKGVEKENENNDIDIENLSPKKDAKPLRVAQGNFSKANLKAYSLLTKKCDVDLIDVSKAVREHSYYPKVTKPYSRLDNLLERRLKLDEIEKKQRDSIQQQLQWKLKLEAAKQEKQEVSASPEKKIIALSRPEVVKKPEPVKPQRIVYGCYSPLCLAGDVLGGQCYSVRCRYETEQEDEEEDLDVDDAGEVQMEVDEDDDEKVDDDKDSESKNDGLNKSSTEDEEVDVIGDKDDTNDTAAENISSNNANKSSNASKVVHVPYKKDEGVKPSSSGGVTVKTGLLSPSAKKTTTISIPGNLAQLIAQKTGKNLTYSEAQAFIRQALEKMTVEDIKAKIPPIRKITDKVHLPKITKGGIKKKSAKKTSLPPAHKFITPSSKKSLFVLERWEGRKLARKGGKIEVIGFKYECKMSNVNWPYPCPRPLFKTAFNYRLQTIKSLAAAALHLRIFWTCIRWDDMAQKPPAGGTNTISTETEITTTELLKRKDIGPHGLRSEFLVRKIIVPLGVPQQPKGEIFYFVSIRFVQA